MAIEIVDLPIENRDFPVRHVSFPEANWAAGGIGLSWYIKTLPKRERGA
jgi:hypothetical protein